jgi:hypothetical protein
VRGADQMKFDPAAMSPDAAYYWRTRDRFEMPRPK